MRLTKLHLAVVGATVALAACTPAAEDPQDVFFNTIAEHCGNAYEGRVTSGNPETDATWMNNRIVIEVRECTENRIRIPLHVGDNHSRTWIITRLPQGGLELKHDHRLEDGSHDPMTMYGGSTVTPGTPTAQAFPADEYSKQLFTELDATVSITNTWWLSFPDENTMRYRLSRENREFHVDVDLSSPLPADDFPPLPWGWEDHYQY
ncbi:MAG: hypothetical protein LAT77_06870 [Aliidiomarina sp.]|uniref:hypothetical protein n=1 Tax=Aliidiomarina sp. TaxID=1872439 RepID=UPI0025C5E002|nr:hypothetical protein [Aliidiomarina sp.]MCH8501618.1 hypothetical protein [Aliidiomarina sp.]